jgi:hypothetical protein
MVILFPMAVAVAAVAVVVVVIGMSGSGGKNFSKIEKLALIIVAAIRLPESGAWRQPERKGGRDCPKRAVVHSGRNDDQGRNVK